MEVAEHFVGNVLCLVGVTDQSEFRMLGRIIASVYPVFRFENDFALMNEYRTKRMIAVSRQHPWTAVLPAE